MSTLASRSEILEAVVSVLKQVRPDLDAVSEETSLMGQGAVIDSIGMVSFLITLEQSLNNRVDLSALMLERGDQEGEGNPFRTVGSLANVVSSSLERG